MGVFNKAIPDINLNDKDEPIAEYQQPVYIDDMFDPLFNKNVRNYLKDKYKYPIYRTLAGFAEGLDNALVPSRSQGQWGIMGPSMGILSNFGRTMDKAGDFLIGGVTEGINATSKLLGNDVEVNNPLKEIFVNDEDYSGQRLLASMTNSMSKLAGGTKVDESAFRGMWAIPSTALELALDPGVLGGSVARRLASTSRNLTSREILHNIGNKIGNDNFKGAVGDVAQLLSNYDDVMTKIAFDYTAPGLRPAVKKFAHHINSTLGNYSTKPFIDVIKEYVENNPDVTDFDISKINMHNIDNIYNMDTPSVPPTINQTDNAVVNNINENSTPNVLNNTAKELNEFNNRRTFPYIEMYDVMLKEIEDSYKQHKNFKLESPEDLELFYFIHNLRNNIKPLKLSDEHVNSIAEQYAKLISQNKKLKELADIQKNSLTKEQYKVISEFEKKYAKRLYTSNNSPYTTIREFINTKENADAFTDLIFQLENGKDTNLGPGYTYDFSKYYKDTMTDSVPDNLFEEYSIDIARLADDLDRGVFATPNSLNTDREMGNLRNLVYGLMRSNVEKASPSITILDSSFIKRNNTPAVVNYISNELYQFVLRNFYDEIPNLDFSRPVINTGDVLNKLKRNILEAYGVDVSKMDTKAINESLNEIDKHLNYNLNTIKDILDPRDKDKFFSDLNKNKNTKKGYKKKYDYNSDDYLNTFSKYYEDINKLIQTADYLERTSYKNIPAVVDFINTTRKIENTIAYQKGVLEDEHFKANESLLYGSAIDDNEKLENTVLEGKSKNYFSDNLSKTLNYELRKNPNFLLNKNGEIDFNDAKDIYDMFKKQFQVKFNKNIRIFSPDDTKNSAYIEKRLDNIEEWAKKSYKRIFSPPQNINFEAKDLKFLSDNVNKFHKLVYNNPNNLKILNNIKDLEITSEAYKKKIEPLLKQDNKFFKEFLEIYKDKKYENFVNILNPKNKLNYNTFFKDSFNENYYFTHPSKDMSDREAKITKYVFGSLNNYLNIPRDGIEGMKRRIDNLKKGFVEGDEVLPFLDAKYKIKKIPETAILSKNIKEQFIDTNLLTKDAIKKSQENAIKQSEVEESLVKLGEESKEDFKKEMIKPTTPNDEIIQEVTEEVVGEIAAPNTQTKEVFGNVENQVKALSNPREWRLFTQIDKANSIKSRMNDNARIFLENDTKFQSSLNEIKRIKSKFNDEKKFYNATKKYYYDKDLKTDDFIKGDNFINHLITSNAKEVMLFRNKKALQNAYATINRNITQINNLTKHQTVKLDIIKIPSTEYSILRYYWNPDNKYFYKDIQQLSKYNLKLDNIYFHKALSSNTKIDETYLELDNLTNNVSNATKEMMKRLGFDAISDDYFKHTIVKQPATANFLNEQIYKDLDLDVLETLNDYAYNVFNLNGALRIREQTRGLHGLMEDWNNLASRFKDKNDKPIKLFSTSPETILYSQYSEGIFKNINYQIFHELFINDNYKISQFAKSIKDIKDVLFVKDANGNYSGNLDNLELVSPKYNELGKLIGFRRYDKFNDLDLNNALKNKDTILIPTSIITPLDRILRKDIKMSNKIYRFINKLTIPFKYSILCNPGFLLGNISDAGIKQVLAMSQKYGTTVSEEIKRMTTAVKHVIQINNSFDRVYNKYIGLFELVESKLPPEEKIPSLVMNNKTAYTKFINFVNKNKDAFTKNERFIINAYVFLNRKQVTSVLGQNAEDVIARQNKIDMSEYIDPKNPISRLFTGKSNYDSKQISSWGIFMNNPIINAIMKKSEQIESLARSSALLNDLEHNYNSLGELFSDINKYMAPKDVRKKLNFKNREFGVKVQEAINATYNSNFDYENMPFLMDAASTVIPFPTFFLKNIGYWLDIIVNNPQVLDKAIRIQQGLWSSVDEEELKEDEFKAEAKGRGAIPLDVTNLPKLNDFFKGIYKPAPLNSLFSMFNLMQEPIPNLAYRINPLFSLATIPFQDSESVRYRPYNSDLYQPNIKKDNPEFNNLNYLFHRLNPYDRLIGNALRLPNKISNGSLQLADLTSSMFQPDF